MDEENQHLLSGKHRTNRGKASREEREKRYAMIVK